MDNIFMRAHWSPVNQAWIIFYGPHDIEKCSIIDIDCQRFFSTFQNLKDAVNSVDLCVVYPMHTHKKVSYYLIENLTDTTKYHKVTNIVSDDDV